MKLAREHVTTVVSQKYAQTQKYAHPSFSLQVIAKGPLLLESTLTQETKICSSMHIDEISTVCLGLLYLVLHVHDNGQTHSSRSC